MASEDVKEQGMVAHARNASTVEDEAGSLQVQDQSGPYSKFKACLSYIGKLFQKHIATRLNININLGGKRHFHIIQSSYPRTWLFVQIFYPLW